jgi:hypothetical protein
MMQLWNFVEGYVIEFLKEPPEKKKKRKSINMKILPSFGCSILIISLNIYVNILLCCMETIAHR